MKGTESNVISEKIQSSDSKLEYKLEWKYEFIELVSIEECIKVIEIYV